MERDAFTTEGGREGGGWRDEQSRAYFFIQAHQTLTAFVEVVDECVYLTAAEDVLVLGGAVESQVVHSQPPLPLQVSVEQCSLDRGKMEEKVEQN